MHTDVAEATESREGPPDDCRNKTMVTSNSISKRTNFGALEFEPIDLAEARKVLDDLPAGIEAVQTMTPGYWQSRRRKTEPTDRALTGVALDWMMTMPAALRPAATAQAFPRIVNAIARAWSDPDECHALLDSLVNDRRPGRRGFPTPVRSELEALYSAQIGERTPAA